MAPTAEAAAPGERRWEGISQQHSCSQSPTHNHTKPRTKGPTQPHSCTHNRRRRALCPRGSSLGGPCAHNSVRRVSFQTSVGILPLSEFSASALHSTTDCRAAAVTQKSVGGRTPVSSTGSCSFKPQTTRNHEPKDPPTHTHNHQCKAYAVLSREQDGEKVSALTRLRDS